MLSPADMLILGAAALMFFGPDQLPKVARRAGKVVRDVQATSQSFIREMERAGDEPEPAKHDWSAMHADYNSAPPGGRHGEDATRTGGNGATAVMPATRDLDAPKHLHPDDALAYFDWAQEATPPHAPDPPPRHMAPEDPIAGPAPGIPPTNPHPTDRPA